MRIRECNHGAHAAPILDIVNEAIANSTALFDYEPRSLESMAAWFRTKTAGGHPVLGAFAGERLLGFASYGPFRAWPAYKYTVEHSVYVHAAARGRGAGRALVQALIERAGQQDYHTLVAGIVSTNGASIALHEHLGFEHCGTVRQVGWKFGQWLDLAFYQRLLRTPLHPVDG